MRFCLAPSPPSPLQPRPSRARGRGRLGPKGAARGWRPGPVWEGRGQEGGGTLTLCGRGLAAGSLAAAGFGFPGSSTRRFRAHITLGFPLCHTLGMFPERKELPAKPFSVTDSDVPVPAPEASHPCDVHTSPCFKMRPLRLRELK